MDKPVLVVMAAGMGSRYGGNKQIDHIGPHGEILLEYSIYDAVTAGFDKVVFVIKRSMADTFRELIGDKIAKKVEVEYAYQEYDSLPDGFVLPEGRTKPYGTVHAVLVAKDLIHEPFAVINADDFYGRGAIDAIAAGKEAAISLHRYVHEGQSLTIGRNRRVYPELDKRNVALPTACFDAPVRQVPAALSGAEARKTFRDPRCTFTEEQVRRECARCLGCGASWVDPNKCIGCGVCTTKCVFDAIHLKRDHPECSTMMKAEDKLKGIASMAGKRLGESLRGGKG